MAATPSGRWPAIPVADWQDTRDTLHLYTQVIGKVRLANEPHRNHWWNTTLYVTARGLTTSLMPHPTGPAFQVDFDLLDHRLDIATASGEQRSLDLVPRFVGKASPVHYFWGAIDLAYTRFSGRTAPPHPGGAPNCGPHVMWEAYSHEVSSCGYWPGPPGGEGVFYAYAYPEPPGYRDLPVTPAGARWDDDLGEFVLPYELVRTDPDTDALLLEFLQSTYEAAAVTARWDRSALERPNGAGRG